MDTRDHSLSNEPSFVFCVQVEGVQRRYSSLNAPPLYDLVDTLLLYVQLVDTLLLVLLLLQYNYFTGVYTACIECLCES